MSRIDDILNNLTDAPATPSTAKVASEGSGLDAAIQTALANLERTKVASAQAPANSPVSDLMKIAEEIRAADEEAEIKIASRSGAAFVDSMMERLELYRAQAAELDKQASLQDDVLSKFAQAYPEQYAALVQAGHFEDPGYKQAFDEDFRAEAAAIHEKAAAHFMAGYAALEQAVA